MILLPSVYAVLAKRKERKNGSGVMGPWGDRDEEGGEELSTFGWLRGIFSFSGEHEGSRNRASFDDQDIDELMFTEEVDLDVEWELGD